jgi:hypothetical protein
MVLRRNAARARDLEGVLSVVLGAIGFVRGRYDLGTRDVGPGEHLEQHGITR